MLADSQKFKRWQWIRYSFSKPKSDMRPETQRVIPESITLESLLIKSERPILLNPLIRGSLATAAERGESLTMLRPKHIEFNSMKKSLRDLENERDKHADLAKQLSMLDKTAKPLEPCPYVFHLIWEDQDGKRHKHECDDWETVQAFRNFRNLYGEQKAIKTLKNKYEDEYFPKGLVLSFSTHSRRNKQWLLVGMIRLDPYPQGDIFLGR